MNNLNSDGFKQFYINSTPKKTIVKVTEQEKKLCKVRRKIEELEELKQIEEQFSL